MNTFKNLYLQAKKEISVNEGLGDLIGDKIDAAKKAISDKLNITPGGTNVMSRLFNVENEIIKLLDTKQYKALGKLLIDKKIPQNFAFKRVTLFTGKNAALGTKPTTYRDIPLFFALTAMLIDGKNGNLIGSLNKIYTEIKSAGIDISYYLNRIDTKHQDLISFLMIASKQDISGDVNKPSAFESVFIQLIRTLMLYGYNCAANNNLAIKTAIRIESLPILMAFFEGKVKAKLTVDIEQEADQVDNAEIIKYIEVIKAGKTSASMSTPGKSKLDFAAYGLHPKLSGTQKLTHAAALSLLTDLSKEAGKPLDAAKTATFKKNKAALQTSLIAALQKLSDVSHNITIE